MSALWAGEPAGASDERVLVPMKTTHLDAVMAIEAAAYAFPWTRGNFIDSLAAGYPARVLLGAQRQLLGYFITMPGVDEMHLLNITVAPAEQGRGHARCMIDALIPICQEHAARELWLEVRDSNERARAMYFHFGFTAVGVRKGYYPAPFGRREDAVVMSLNIGAAAQGTNDALE
jgi:[ribosomal protein S18]-alanine N-acetyltransferase